MRRRAGGLAATLLIAACVGDQSSGPLPPALTTAQLALYYDSLAGLLSPSDSRIHWLQQIDNGLAFGAPRTPIEIDVAGQSNIYWAVAFATITPLQTRVDSTYVLAAWTGDLVPFSFLEVTINYVGDTAESQVVYYADSTAPGLTGSNTVAAVQGVVVHDACTPVTLVHLYTPTGACTLMTVQFGYQSSINGMPFRAMAGARLTPAG
ncbi:MAG TPA: hypothetical protein VK679_17350 [Gemmatimonadaceae bacterium]|jgi:hypothetical protein|nr:hypothetical protein [Gemmatimonadaceae bacterium]